MLGDGRGHETVSWHRMEQNEKISLLGDCRIWRGLFLRQKEFKKLRGLLFYMRIFVLGTRWSHLRSEPGDSGLDDRELGNWSFYGQGRPPGGKNQTREVKKLLFWAAEGSNMVDV